MAIDESRYQNRVEAKNKVVGEYKGSRVIRQHRRKVPREAKTLIRSWYLQLWYTLV